MFFAGAGAAGGAAARAERVRIRNALRIQANSVKRVYGANGGYEMGDMGTPVAKPAMDNIRTCEKCFKCVFSRTWRRTGRSTGVSPVPHGRDGHATKV